MSKQSRETLKFTSDGKFLLDSTGNKVKQYLESAQAFVPMLVKDKQGIEFDPANALDKGFGQGHHFYPCNCHDECMAWDQNGNCTQTYRSCDICWTPTEDDIIK